MEINIQKDYRLAKLQQFLDYEISGALLYIVSFFYGIAIYLVIIAAVLFTPYMLSVLFREKRFGWIIFFTVIVIIPLIMGFILNIGNSAGSILKMISLAMFYIFCFILRMAIRDWNS